MQPLWRKVWRFLKTLKIGELPYDPAILLLKTYPKETKRLACKYICAPMFILVLFTITKIWKQPRIWMKREKQREKGILFSHKNKEISPFVTT